MFGFSLVLPHAAAAADPVVDDAAPSVLRYTPEGLSEGEVNFLWWFAQGGIMDPVVRWSLRHGWGLCPRHAAGWLIVEAAFRHSYLHGPAVLYDDLMERAVAAFDLHGPWVRERVARQLHARGPCQLCAMGMTSASRGFIRPDRLQTGRDARPWCAFMARTRAYWRPQVCGICAHDGAAARCRRHLCEDITLGHIDSLAPHFELAQDVARHIHRYDGSFCCDSHGSETLQDRAALVSAAGWCGGWQVLLGLDAAEGQR